MYLMTVIIVFLNLIFNYTFYYINYIKYKKNHNDLRLHTMSLLTKLTKYSIFIFLNFRENMFSSYFLDSYLYFLIYTLEDLKPHLSEK